MAEAWKRCEGQTVNGAFQLGEYLGGSQQSAVFQAQFGDQDPHPAAIKLIAGNSPQAENRLATWQFASRLSHPNLIRIYQTGRCQIDDAKFVYVVMEYAEENLSQILPHRALTEAEAAEMLNPALSALAFLHANGLAHGPIKPADIMASGDQLKLSTDGLRRAGEPISFPSEYDPPEATSAPAGDIWSLGLMLVEVLTQHLPPRDSDSQDPLIPRTMPSSLRDIARHCLRRDPRRRWTIADIAAHLGGSPVPTPLAPETLQQKASPRSNRYLIAALILFLASVGFVGSKLLKDSHQGAAQLPKTPSSVLAPSPQPTPGPPTQPRPVQSAAPRATKPAAPIAKQDFNGDSQSPVAAPAVEAPTRPAAVAASSSHVVHQALPDVSQKARNTIRGTVRVGINVSVNSSGEVTNASIASRGPSSYFADLALQAARQWKFSPSTGAASNWTLRFEFTPEGTKTSAEQSTP